MVATHYEQGLKSVAVPCYLPLMRNMFRRTLLYRMLAAILANLEKIMSDVTNLNAAIDALKAEVGDIGTRMDKLFSDLQAALAGGNQAAIDAATAAINDQVQALKDIATRDTPVPTP